MGGREHVCAATSRIRPEQSKQTLRASAVGRRVSGRARLPYISNSSFPPCESLHSNKTAPPAQPLLANGRSLPSSILAPRISSHSPGSSSPSAPGNSDEYNSRPPPQILRREQRKDEGAGANSAAHQMQKKTLAEREDEYRKARERIFGTSDAKARSPSSQNGSAGKASPGTGSRQRSGHTTPTSEGEKASTRQP